MSREADSNVPLLESLEAIHSTLQDLLIFEGCRNGMRKEQVRKMLGVNNNRVSRVWKHLKSLEKVKSNGKIPK